MQFSEPLRACGFAVGATRYSDHLPGRAFPAQIVLPVNLGGVITIQAVVDTGSTWCILNPELIGLLGDAVDDAYVPAERLIIRGELYTGRLVRLPMRLQAEIGDDVEIEATAFVPTLSPGELWAFPDFIGLVGFLQRVRIAIDPSENVLYFGPT